MSAGLRRRRRLAFAWLLLFAAWPLAHRALVARYDLDPWRFFGWAMYCVPKLELEVEVYVDSRQGNERRVTPHRLSDAASYQRVERQYIRERRIWGDLAPPDAVAEALFENLPHASWTRIVVRRLILDTSTARVSARERSYRYER